MKTVLYRAYKADYLQQNSDDNEQTVALIPIVHCCFTFE